MNTQKISQTDHNQSRMRTCIRLSLLALLLAAGMLLPRAAHAVPDEEQSGLSGATSNTQNPTAVAIYSTYGYILVANRTSNTLSIFDLQTGEPIEDAMGDPWNKAVATTPVAIAIREVTSALPFEPTEAYAYVAGFGGQAISIVDLTAVPPVVLTADEIDLTEASETATPGPVALMVVGDTLYVANGSEGTIQRYDVSALPAVPVAFGTASPSQTTASGNLVPCQEHVGAGNASVTDTARPRVLYRYSQRNWVGCDSGDSGIGARVGHFTSAGELALRTDLIGAGNGLGSVKGLAGDPRGDASSGGDILYVLDDIDGYVVALDVELTMSTATFEEAMDPVIAPICAIGSVAQNGIPIDQDPNSTAMIAVTDTSSTNGGDFLAVFSTSGASTLDLINLSGINRETGDTPECGLTADITITKQVDLNLASSSFPPNTLPTNIGQQIAQNGAYIAVPNYGASGGVNMVSLITDAPLLTPVSNATVALTNAGSSSPVPVTTATFTFDSTETVASSPAPVVRARERGNPATTKVVSVPDSVTGDQLMLNITSTNLESSGVVGASDNKTLELIFSAADGDSDLAVVSREIIFDTTDPMITDTNPMNADVLTGSNMLRVEIPSAADDTAPGVYSGIGGFYVTFTDALDEKGDSDPNLIPDPVQYPASTQVFIMTGLTNRVTYVFNVQVVDKAGNISVETVTGLMGTPTPGVSLLDLLGENGCVFSPRARGWGVGELLLWLGAFAIVITVRRRGVRA